MKRIDCNCFLGSWPFHFVRNHNFEALKKLHAENDITSGFVSSTEAIFYNDPYEADKRLAVTLKDSNYRHVVTVNPTLPGCCDSLRRMIKEFPVAGVRILPSFHGYTLQDEGLERLCAVLSEYKIPLFLTLRMEDERVVYMLQPQDIPVWDISMFISNHQEFPILLCNVRSWELSWLSSTFQSYEHVFADCCGLKNGLFGIDEIKNETFINRLVYGSLSPLFCIKSTMLLIEKANINKQLKESILSAQGFLKIL